MPEDVSEMPAQADPADRPADLLDRTPPQAVFERHFELRRRLSVLILCLLSAVLLTISFPPFDVWWVAYVALVPWVLGVIGGTRRRSTLLLAWLAGGVFWSLLLYWLLLPTMGGAIATIVYLSLYWLLAAVVLRKTARRNWPSWIVLPMVWVGLEYVRAYVISGFPWFYLAQTQYARTPLIQISDVTGQYGVSFFVAMVNGLFVDILSAPLFVHSGKGVVVTRRIPIGIGVCLLVLAGLLGYGGWRLGQETRRPGPMLGIVQEAVPISLQGREASDVDVMLDHLDRSLQLIGADCDAVLLPETMLPTGLNREVVRLDVATLDDASAASLSDKLLGRGASIYFSPPELRSRLATYIGRDPVESYLPDALVVILGTLVEPAEYARLSNPAVRQVGASLFGPAGPRASDAALRAAAGAYVRGYEPQLDPAVSAEAAALLKTDDLATWRQRNRYGHQQAAVRRVGCLRGHAALVQATALLLEASIIGGTSAIVPNERPTGPADIWVYSNAAIRIDPTGIKADSYAKMHLVPFSEYVPFKYGWPGAHRLLRWFVPEVMPQIEGGRQPRRFDVPASQGDYQLATPICYEGTFARVCRELVNAGPKDRLIVANLSNDGWFTHRGSFFEWLGAGFANDPQAGPWQGTTEQAQHLSHYVFRAIESRVAVVRSVNTGISGHIDSNGQIETLVQQMARGSRQRTMIAGELAVRPLVDSRVTVYSRIGDLFALTVTLAAGILVAWMIWRKPT